MFTTKEVSDKYKILYLDNEVKNKFISLLLIGLDKKYMDVGLNTLNDSSEHYKEKLNKRCQKKFNKNFNLNTKSHLSFLANICEVNLTIRNLTKNLNKYSINRFNKTVYLVNKGNEYGLVLKNNKKSTNTALTNSDLPKLENLSSRLKEGGENGEEDESMGGGPFQLNIKEGIVNKLSSAFTDAIVNEVYEWCNMQADIIINLNKPESGEIFTFNNYFTYLRNIKESTEEINAICGKNGIIFFNKIYSDSIKNEMDNLIRLLNKLEEESKKKPSSSPGIPVRLPIGKQRKQQIPPIPPSVYQGIAAGGGSSSKKSSKNSSSSSGNKYEDLGYEVWFNTILNLFIHDIKNEPIVEEISMGDGDGDGDRNDEEMYDDGDGDRNDEEMDDVAAENKRLMEMLTDEEMDDKVMGDDGVVVDATTTDVDMSGKKSGGSMIGSAITNPVEFVDLDDKKKQPQPKKDIKGIDKTLKLELDNMSVIELLERGIDSAHDFGGGLYKDCQDIPIKSVREPFDIFYPANIDDQWYIKATNIYDTYAKMLEGEEIGTGTGPTKKKTPTLYGASYIKAFYNRWQDLIRGKLLNNLKFMYKFEGTYKGGKQFTIEIPFKPDIVQQKTIKKEHNPFSENWEAISTLYWKSGNTTKDQRSQDLYDNCNKSGKNLILFLDAGGATTTFTSFFSNIEMRPESFYGSYDNHKKSLAPADQVKFEAHVEIIANSLKYIDKNLTPGKTEYLKKRILANILSRRQFKKIKDYISSKSTQELFKDATGILNTNSPNIITSYGEYYLRTPANAIDPASTGGGQNILISDINKLIKLNPTQLSMVIDDESNNLKLNYKVPTPPKKKPIDPYNIIENVDPTNKKNYTLYKLINTTNNIEEDVLYEVYKTQFNRVSQNSVTNLPPKPPGQSVPPDEYNRIRFDFRFRYEHDTPYTTPYTPPPFNTLNENKKLDIILKISYYPHDAYSLGTDKNIYMQSKKIIEVPFEKMPQISTIDNVLKYVCAKESDLYNIYLALKQIFTNGLKEGNKMVIQPNQPEIQYLSYIADFIDDWGLFMGIPPKPKSTLAKRQRWPSEQCRNIFIRMLYTFKMIGDQGQVNFIDYLNKKVLNTKKYKTAFISEDSMAILYACNKEVTNISMTESNCPSLEYCKSTPRGMVSYDDQPTGFTGKTSLFKKAS